MGSKDERVPVYLVDSISQRKTSKGKPFKLPTNRPSGLLATQVAVQVFNLGSADEKGNKYDYRFRDESERILNPDETLEQAKVQPRSILYLTYMPTAAGRGQ